jgi:hypothetical protein
MDLDSRAYSKLVSVTLGNVNFVEYRRILEALCPLGDRYDHETPEMWCFRIRDPFRKILKENQNLRILSGNGFITMHRKLYDGGHGGAFPTNYIYCSVCDSLVFIPENGYSADPYRDNHLKSCINEDTISKEHTRRKEILQSIDRREFQIW